MPENISARGSPARSASAGETSGRPRSSSEPAHHDAYAYIFPMNSHGSSSVTTSVSGVLVVRSTHGACSSRWLGCGPPRSRTVSAAARAMPPPAESPTTTTRSEVSVARWMTRTTSSCESRQVCSGASG